MGVTAKIVNIVSDAMFFFLIKKITWLNYIFFLLRLSERERESIMNCHIFKLEGIKFHGCLYGLESPKQSHRSPLQYMVVVATCNIGS